MKLFIADDETDVREGLRYILDWSALDFYICGEGKNGQDTLTQILNIKPDVVLLDIRMPKLSGLDVVRQSKEQGFKGKFIILSGYSDFAYAQESMRYGVTSYLTKPIDEAELQKAVIEARESILSEQDTQKKLTQYRNKARSSILKDVLLNSAQYESLDYKDLHMECSIYQVLIYSNYNQDSFNLTWNFAEILRLANKNNDSLDYVLFDDLNIIILKGDSALNRFQQLLNRYIAQPQKGSPLDSLFIAYGRPVYSVETIWQSFDDARYLINRRFFCSFNQHVLGYNELPNVQNYISYDMLKKDYAELISNYIQSGNMNMINEILNQLQDQLYYVKEDITTLKHYLTDIIIQVKSNIDHAYGSQDIPITTNASIIKTIEEKYYLYEIMQFFTMQFNMYINALGSSGRDSIIDNILQYIEHNYRENLKLGSIATLFGYNSSYLGKVFTKTTGKTFNSYIDEVRIRNSKELLLNPNYKVYEISQLVGYANVDYFHKKFKKYVGMSPAEYRKANID